MISSDNKTYRLLRCPYCKCYDANHFYEVKTPLPVRFSHADTTEAAAPIHPIVCGRCGGIFVKFTDLELLNSYVPPGKERRMKPEEAIERLHQFLQQSIGIIEDANRGDDYAVKVKEDAEKDLSAIQLAIEALKEVQQYREIGTVEECREAVEKQKAKDMITARNADRGYCDKEE